MTVTNSSKQKQINAYLIKDPYPEFKRPTDEEAREVKRRLEEWQGVVKERKHVRVQVKDEKIKEEAIKMEPDIKAENSSLKEEGVKKDQDDARKKADPQPDEHVTVKLESERESNNPVRSEPKKDVSPTKTESQPSADIPSSPLSAASSGMMSPVHQNGNSETTQKSTRHSKRKSQADAETPTAIEKKVKEEGSEVKLSTGKTVIKAEPSRKTESNLIESIAEEKVKSEVKSDLHSERAGCGDAPCVIEALLRTILSQNTTDKNATSAWHSLLSAFHASSKNPTIEFWDTIRHAPHAEVKSALQCGGLADIKARNFQKILNSVNEKYGVCSLDHLYNATDEEAMRELMSFDGVGPKTASCVLLFCLNRASFAVDTHVYRITGMLGWYPPKSNREQAQSHMDSRLAEDIKYPLHCLLVAHGKICAECSIGPSRPIKSDSSMQGCPIRDLKISHASRKRTLKQPKSSDDLSPEAEVAS